MQISDNKKYFLAGAILDIAHWAASWLWIVYSRNAIGRYIIWRHDSELAFSLTTICQIQSGGCCTARFFNLFHFSIWSSLCWMRLASKDTWLVATSKLGNIYNPSTRALSDWCTHLSKRISLQKLIFSSRAKLSMEEMQTESQVIKADSSLATTLSRLANVRVQVELIQEDTKSLKQGFADMARRVNVLTASFHEERDTILKRRTKAWDRTRFSFHKWSLNQFLRVSGRPAIWLPNVNYNRHQTISYFPTNMASESPVSSNSNKVAGCSYGRFIIIQSVLSFVIKFRFWRIAR